MTPRLTLLAPALCAVAWTALPALAEDDALALLEQRTEELAREMAPAVVCVTAVTEPPAAPRLVLPGLVLTPVQRESERLEASGFLVKLEGVVATTIELTRADATFEIRFADGSRRKGRLMGADEPFRVAFLRVDPPRERRALDSAAASAEGTGRAIAWLLSAVPRAEPDVQLLTVRSATCSRSGYDRWLSAMASLRPGAAGGPLLGRDGRLLGMAVGSVEPRESVPSTSPQGPTALFVRGEDVLEAAQEIFLRGRVRRARLGVLVDGDGNRVDQIVPGGPAEAAGLREGDEVTSIGGKAVAGASEITRALLRRKPGESVEIEARRGGEPIRATVRLDEIDLPPVPATAPLAGVVLEMPWPSASGAAAAADAPVSVREVDAASPFAAAGLLPGDEVLSVDAMDVRRFLARHRVRPEPTPPAEVTVRRAGREISLPRPQ